jgi:sigma-B regulation protein RsbU (phosphoserine phosphatase)
MHVLIADDDQVFRRLLQVQLIKWGYDVVTAENGADAWNCMQRADAPHMAILDWMMPDIDGLELCRRLRSLERTRNAYIIMVTSKDRKQDIVTALEAGADDYLSKPFDPDELRARLHAGVRIRQLQDELSARIHELEAALANVNLLHGLLPICCYCKKVRNDQNYWEQVDNYISDHTNLHLNRVICPDCEVRHAPVVSVA